MLPSGHGMAMALTDFEKLWLLAQDLNKIKPGSDPIIDWGDNLQVTTLTQKLWVVDSY